MKKSERENAESLMKYKKLQFLEAVKKAADYLQFRCPEVRFWKTYDSRHFDKGERAHIHLEQNTICISEKELEIMDNDEIDETARHEVSHLKDSTHNQSFINTKDETKAGSWTPPTGIGLTMIDGNYTPSKDEPDKPRPPDKKRCNYHLCRKREKLFQCKHCDRYFCSKHKAPKIASLALFNSTGPEADMLMEEYHRENAHPCMPYGQYWQKKMEREKSAWTRTLNELTGHSVKSKSKPLRISHSFENYIKNESYEPNPPDFNNMGSEEDYVEKHTPYKNPRSRFNKKWIIIFGLLMILIGLWYLGVLGNLYSRGYNSLSDGFIGNSAWRNIFPSKSVDTYKDTTFLNSLNSLRENKSLSAFNFELNDYNRALEISKAAYYKEKIQEKDYVVLGLSHFDNETIWDSEISTFPQQIEIQLNSLDNVKLFTAGAIGCYKFVCTFVGSVKTGGGAPESVNKIFRTDLEQYKTNPKTINLGGFDFVVYGGVNDYLAGLDRSISYYYISPTTKDFIMKDLDNSVQKVYLEPLVQKIQEQSTDKKYQAIISINIVQGIPYDWASFSANSVKGRLPYQVLYDMTGVCMEKADLLAFILRDLGYGVVIFEFNSENHRAVGIKCSNGNYNTDYCFIEATDYYPIGQIPEQYVGGVDIRNAIPEVVTISDGISFD